MRIISLLDGLFAVEFDDFISLQLNTKGFSPDFKGEYGTCCSIAGQDGVNMQSGCDLV